MTPPRTTPENTKLTICVWHPFTEWRPPASLADAIRQALARHVCRASSGLRPPSGGTSRHGHLRGYSLRAKQLAEAKKLKWIHSTAAGVAQLMYTELRDSGILVTNPSGIFSVADGRAHHGPAHRARPQFSGFCSLSGSIKVAQQDLWDQPQHHLTELNGQVLLVVGYGSIGHELARRAKAFDMRVWGVSRSGKGDASLAEKIVPIAQLHEVLSHADFVVVSAPETRETMHLIGATRTRPHETHGPPHQCRAWHLARSIRATRRSSAEKNRRRRPRCH